MKTSEEVLRLQRARDTLTDLTAILDRENLDQAATLEHLRKPAVKMALDTAVTTLSEEIRRH
mgnify:CR=1 FL=1